MKKIIVEAMPLVTEKVLEIIQGKLQKRGYSYLVLDWADRGETTESYDFVILRGSAFGKLLEKKPDEEWKLSLKEEDLVGDFFIQGDGKVSDLSKVVWSKYFKLRKVTSGEGEVDLKKLANLRVAVSKIVDEIVFSARSDSTSS